ncbi:MAG: 2-dehydro-3-deoxygalactonokinase [Candidatus Korobacteraceae bacterium]|jgi:2-dehydro-3-deoxygalactonokinase
MSTAAPVPRLIALDWGTSSLRAYLLGAGGAVLEQSVKPWGIMRTSKRSFAKVFAAMVGEWRRRWPNLPVLAAGMIGSAQGWREAPYVPCPAGLRSLAAGLVNVTESGRIQLHIIPGVVEEGDIPDVMRGEETQIIGAMELDSRLRRLARLVLPGTHSKWVELRKERIQSFSTYMTGELFAVLRDHSILGRAVPVSATLVASWAAFERGLMAVLESGSNGGFSRLFSTRTLTLRGRLRPEESLDYLSGLLIGEELRCATHRFNKHVPLAIVGEDSLCERYRRALALFGFDDARIIVNASPIGLWRIANASGLVKEMPSPTVQP